MRRAAPGLAALLAACSGGGAGEALVPREHIWCALGQAHTFTRDCTVERGSSGSARTFIVRHPGGEFHRLEASADGQRLLAADGAQPSQSALKEGRYEVILGDARYVIPRDAPAS